MKKIFFLVFLITAGLCFAFLKENGQKINRQKKISVVATTAPEILTMPKNTVELKYKDNLYWVSWFELNDLSKLHLYSNHKDKLSSTESKNKYHCKNLINANFYDTKGNPLGLFYSQNNYYGKKIESFLFNGVFFLDNQFLPEITSLNPPPNISMGLQSGPIIWLDFLPKQLKIIDDKQARRMALLINKNNQLFFLAIYDKDSELLGPYLSHLPEILKILQGKNKWEIKSAINLDGGSASALITDSVSIIERSMIGGFFCL